MKGDLELWGIEIHPEFQVNGDRACQTEECSRKNPGTEWKWAPFNHPGNLPLARRLMFLQLCWESWGQGRGPQEPAERCRGGSCPLGTNQILRAMCCSQPDGHCWGRLG